MDADAHISPIAGLIADPTRSAILWALSDGRALPACDLALSAGVKAPTVSYHLAKLIEGGLVTGERYGRHRYYRLRDPAVVTALEALATFAPPAPARTFREGQRGKALRFARTCYDHLAGRLGVEVTEALVRRGYLADTDGDFRLTATGERFFEEAGVDVAAARRRRRAFCRRCLDWSERRFHLAGALGSAWLDHLFAREWIRRVETGRAVLLLPAGREALRELLGVEG